MSQENYVETKKVYNDAQLNVNKKVIKVVIHWLNDLELMIS